MGLIILRRKLLLKNKKQNKIILFVKTNDFLSTKVKNLQWGIWYGIIRGMSNESLQIKKPHSPSVRTDEAILWAEQWHNFFIVLVFEWLMGLIVVCVFIPG